MLCKNIICAAIIGMMSTLSFCTIGQAVDKIFSGAGQTLSDIGKTVQSVSMIEVGGGGISTSIRNRLIAADRSKRMLQSGLTSPEITADDLKVMGREIYENLDDADIMLSNLITSTFKGKLKKINQHDLKTINLITAKAETKAQFSTVIEATNKIFRDINFNPQDPSSFQIKR